ncbi:MAG: hypothetical protein KJ558_07915 [Gammaproteobacteria bacterium]|nr:hypothetical protein [Gammaproteobacteria bacterium]MBU1654739.1 hypothetical protein [Gammaproteobacteria bacterium]MBU1961615.1 hypothetical protein [Gammaproteobacteria bacterium]
MKKLFLALLALVVLAVGGGLFYLYSNINNLIVEAVETYAPPITKTSVTLDSSSVSFLSGEGSLSGLRIGNPEGYKSGELFKLNKIEVAIDLETITQDVIVIRRIDIITPELTYEKGGPAGSNVEQLVRNIKSFTAAKGKEAPPAAAATAEKGVGQGQAKAVEKKVIIDLVSIRDGKVNASLPMVDQWVQAGLPEISIRNIGRNAGGVTPEEAMKIVMSNVLILANKAVAIPLDELKGRVVDQVQEELGKKVPGLSDSLKGDVGKKLKGLF